MRIKDKTTLKERQKRSKIKNKKYKKLMSSISYKDEGELYLRSLTNANIRTMQRLDNYQLSTVDNKKK